MYIYKNVKMSRHIYYQILLVVLFSIFTGYLVNAGCRSKWPYRCRTGQCVRFKYLCPPTCQKSIYLINCTDGSCEYSKSYCRDNSEKDSSSSGGSYYYYYGGGGFGGGSILVCCCCFVCCYRSKTRANRGRIRTRGAILSPTPSVPLEQNNRGIGVAIINTTDNTVQYNNPSFYYPNGLPPSYDEVSKDLPKYEPPQGANYGLQNELGPPPAYQSLPPERVPPTT